MFRRTNHFVCPTCNLLVPNPNQSGGFLRCSLGHRVDGIKQRPMWLEILIAAVVAFLLSSLLCGLSDAIFGNPKLSSGGVSILYSVWVAFLFSRGRRYQRKGGAVRPLAGQYYGAAIGFFLISLLLLALSAFIY